MKAATYNKYGSARQLSIEELPDPVPGSDDVLVRVQFAALNPKDILVRKGKFKWMMHHRFPKQLGYEMAGVIEDPGKTKFSRGDIVYGMVNGWHGRCCAELVSINKSEICEMPQNITTQEACGIPLAGQTALQALRDIGHCSEGKSVIINGASGGVGTLAIQTAKSLGGIVTAVSSNRNQDLCNSLGSDHFIDYTTQDLLRSDQKFDIFFDVFGNYHLKSIKHLLTRNGIYVTTVPSPGIIKDMAMNPLRRKKSSLVVVKSKSKDLLWLKNEIESERIKPIIDQTYDLKDIVDACEYIETKRARGKVAIRI